MPVDPDASMLSLWQQQSGGSAALLDARAQLRRPPDGPVTTRSGHHPQPVPAPTQSGSCVVRFPAP